MAKFYVQSGELNLVLTANDSRAAAIWAVQRTMSQTLPFLCDSPQDYLALTPVTRLGDTISVSERGFDDASTEVFDTLDVMTEWNQLLVAIDRIERLTAAAA